MFINKTDSYPVFLEYTESSLLTFTNQKAATYTGDDVTVSTYINKDISRKLPGSFGVKGFHLRR